ncbi:MAG: hypothetical protein V3575_05945, partial [Candidatus Absconditabacteria bacterium]
TPDIEQNQDISTPIIDTDQEINQYNEFEDQQELYTPDVSELIEENNIENNEQENTSNKSDGIELDDIVEEKNEEQETSIDIDSLTQQEEISNDATSEEGTGINIDGILNNDSNSIDLDSMIAPQPIILENIQTSKIDALLDEKPTEKVKNVVNLDQVGNESEKVKKELTNIKTKTIKKDRQAKSFMKWIGITVGFVVLGAGAYLTFIISNPLTLQGDINQGANNTGSNETQTGGIQENVSQLTGASLSENTDNTGGNNKEGENVTNNSTLLKKEIQISVKTITSAYKILTTLESSMKSDTTKKVDTKILENIITIIDGINETLAIDYDNKNNELTDKQKISLIKAQLKGINNKLIKYHNTLKTEDSIELGGKDSTKIRTDLRQILKLLLELE